MSENLKNKKKPNFDIYEAAILHNECTMVRDCVKKRREAVQSASDKLRWRAINAGIPISCNYRNFKGIYTQMYIMNNTIECKFSNCKSPKVFKKIVELYSSDREEYDRILALALQSCKDD